MRIFRRGVEGAGQREGANFGCAKKPLLAHKETPMTQSPDLQEDTLYAFEGLGGKNLSDI